MLTIKLSQQQAEKVADSMQQETLYFADYKEWADCIDDYCGHYNIAWRRFAVSMQTETEKEFEAIKKQLQALVKKQPLQKFSISF